MNREKEETALIDGFGLNGWEVSPLTGQIKAPDGTQIHVTPKSIDVLLCLAGRPGEVVTRAELLEKVWAGINASDEALTHCISELRHAFGDSADDPKFLQTIPKRGYRLVARVGTMPGNASDDGEPGNGLVARQLGDLRRRKVFQAVLGYPVLAWLVVQVVDVLWDYLLAPLGAPVWMVPSIVVLLAIGYPVAVFFAWAVDLTPEGIKVTPSRKSSGTAVGLISVSAITVGVAAIGLFLFFNAWEAPETEAEPTAGSTPPVTRFSKSIAVLRFINIGANPRGSYIGDGLTEELIHALANLKSIKVAARTSVWPLAATELAFEEIADRLKVEKILEGSVRIEGDQIRVTAQLIDEDGFHLWSQTYDYAVEDVLTIQRDIALQVVDELNPLLDEDMRARVGVQPTTNGTAYDLYLQGKQFLRQPSTEEALASAEDFFARAIDLDNRFSLAHAGQCETRLARYRLTRDVTEFEAAERACHRALTLDSGLAEVYTALGNLYRSSGQTDKAEQEYLAALNINSTLEEASYGLGRTYQSQGRLQLAEETLARSIELEPGYWGSYMGFGNFLFRQGRYEESIPHYEKVTELAPGYAGGFINLGAANHWLGNWDAAEDAWQKAIEISETGMGYQNLGTLQFYRGNMAAAADFYGKAVEVAPEDHRHYGKLAAAQRHVPELEGSAAGNYRKAVALVNEQLAINPDSAEDLWHLSLYLVRIGDMESARQASDRSLELAPDNPEGYYFAALLEIEAGNAQKALEQLEKAVELGYSLRLLEEDPDLEKLHDDDRFQSLIQ